MKKYKNFFIYNEDHITKDIIKNINETIKVIKVSTAILKIKNRAIHKIIRGIRRTHLNSFFPLKKIWFKNLDLIQDNEENKILVFSIEEIIFAKILNKKFPKSKKIFWCWNKMDSKLILELSKYYDEVWTFDEVDSKKYNLKYASQFYWRNKEKAIKYSEPEKIYFIGVDKNRLETIKKFKDYFIGRKIKFEYFLVKSKKTSYSKEDLLDLKESLITYEEMLLKTLKSKCLLELNSENQNGLTLRALEALFYSKKLITNNQSIQNYDFYYDENIFIINENNLTNEIFKQIEIFLEKPYKKIEESVKEKYTLEAWCEKIYG